jgi:hypothetical protein
LTGASRKSREFNALDCPVEPGNDGIKRLDHTTSRRIELTDIRHFGCRHGSRDSPIPFLSISVPPAKAPIKQQRARSVYLIAHGEEARRANGRPAVRGA